MLLIRPFFIFVDINSSYLFLLTGSPNKIYCYAIRKIGKDVSLDSA